MTVEPTPYELLQELYGLLMIELTRRLREPGQPAELLAVAGRALRNHHAGPETDSDRKQLRRLWKLQLEALLAAVLDKANPPTAATLAEVTRFLAANGISKDARSGVDRARAAASLDAMSRLPFNTGPH